MDTEEFITPIEATTGASEIPCLIFGNGVEIETVVYARTAGEVGIPNRQGRTILTLPHSYLKSNKGIDIVKVHFLPQTLQGERVCTPEEVPKDEKNKIAHDCVKGFLGMARALKSGDIDINGQQSDDYYLYANTSPRFAAFLRARCGFHGTAGEPEVWIKKSEFISEDNIKHMRKNLQMVKNASNW
jgi:hypothetical protein